MKDKIGYVIVCRSSDEPVKPGNKVGYQCHYCEARLQVSPTGLAMLRDHPDAKILCNPCGMLYSAFAEQQGKLELHTGPLAEEYMGSQRSKGDAFADWVREHKEKP